MVAPRDGVRQWASKLDSCPPRQRARLLAEMDAHPLAGVRALAVRWRKQSAAVKAEHARLDRLAAHQLALHASGVEIVAGVDEVGRGALAGPLTVAAVVMDVDCRFEGLDDSKRLLPKRREQVAAEIRARARSVCVVHVSSEEIDAVGIREAVRLGMCRALEHLDVRVGHALVDGNDARMEIPATAVVGGDSLCACIAAASVVAKVERDAFMRTYATTHPGFGLEVNKGYGTAEHLAALASLGPSPIHRRSFAPCSNMTIF